ncbi:MAG: LysM domain-containing protein [Anaerolineaceae bacterium]
MKLNRLYAIFLLFLLLTIVLSGCLVEIEYPPTKTIAPTNTITLQPSKTLTPSPTPTEKATLAPTSTLTPTPAPVTWTVEKGDELMAIAFFYDITLDELLAANPSVTPNWMRVGTVLEIPVTPTPLPTNTPTPTATSTPQSLQSQTPTPSGPLKIQGEPSCFPDALGILNCLALLKNEGEETLENPSLSFTLTSKADNFESELIVFAPLNLLPAEGSLPVLASFPSPVPEEYDLEVQIDSWLPTMPGDNRYAETKITASQISLSDDSLLAYVKGQINLESDGRDIASLWLLATAYDEDGNPIGLRRWEAKLPMTKTENLSFNTIVYSLGPAIHKVELTAEARYQNP